jgi:hypothetical protein
MVIRVTIDPSLGRTSVRFACAWPAGVVARVAALGERAFGARLCARDVAWGAGSAWLR